MIIDKKKLLTVADIVTPGDIVSLLRDNLDNACNLTGVIIITTHDDNTVGVGFAGMSCVEAIGNIEVAKRSLLSEDID